MKSRAIILLPVVLFCCCSAIGVAGEGPYFEKSMILGAHRGGRGLWPENTLFAFQNAEKNWPDVVLETDAQLTFDGYVILLHDGSVDRTTDGTGKISEMTLAEAKKLDAGYRFTRDGGQTFPLRGKGIQIPTLIEVFLAFPDARYVLDRSS